MKIAALLECKVEYLFETVIKKKKAYAPLEERE